MKKIRYYLAIIALIATLSGASLQAMGSGVMANAASSLHVSSVSSPLVGGTSTRSVAAKRYPRCPGGGGSDC
jgi:hypothetical protein